MHGGNNNPGITKAITLGDAWQRLGSLYNSDYPTELHEGKAVAAGVRLSVATYPVELAFADSQPSLTGHAIAVGDSEIWGNSAWIARAWFRNGIAGSNATLIVTPTFAY
jgi:hypothetical protein